MRKGEMGSIIVVINRYRKEHPIKSSLTLLSILVTLFLGRYTCLNYKENHTPKLEVTEPFFHSEPIRDGNVTGVLIYVVNQSNAWAKNVMVDFIIDNGFSKYEKVKYYRKENRIITPKEIPPNGKIPDGYLPQGAAASPGIYQNNEKTLKVDIFINWENDKGEKYSLVVGYESITDNFNKQIWFKRTYKYVTFNNKKEVNKLKFSNKEYLPEDML